MVLNQNSGAFMYGCCLLLDRTGLHRKNPEERKTSEPRSNESPDSLRLCSEDQERICLGISICCETVKLRMR